MRSVASIRIARGAACLALGALASCGVPRAQLARLWPQYEDAVFLVRDGRESSEAMASAGWRADWGGALGSSYAGDGVTVEETSRVDDGARRWSRRFTIAGVASGREVVVHVPTRSADGSPLAIEVNGAPVSVESGMLEAVVPLSRDGATEIVVTRSH